MRPELKTVKISLDNEREIKLEFYKNLSSDSIEDLKRKKRPFHFGAFFFE